MEAIIPLILFPLIFFLFIYFAFLRKLPLARKYKKIIQQIVEKGADDQLTRQLIDFFNQLGNIPNGPSHWDTARANFELVNESDKVSPELKHELRRVLLGKGVNRLQAVKVNQTKKA